MQVAEGIGAYWPIQAYRTNFLFFRGRGAGVAGDGDVSDVSDGPALLKNFALLAVCAKGAKLSAKRALGVTDPKREGWARFGCPISENPEMGHPPPQRNYRIEWRLSGTDVEIHDLLCTGCAPWFPRSPKARDLGHPLI